MIFNAKPSPSCAREALGWTSKPRTFCKNCCRAYQGETCSEAGVGSAGVGCIDRGERDPGIGIGIGGDVGLRAYANARARRISYPLSCLPIVAKLG